jgi:hypothetical protein
LLEPVSSSRGSVVSTDGNLLRRATRPATLRVVLSFAFGLIHGFGFAGVMAELKLPSDRLAAALLGFNAGVELGQLAVVATIWPILRALDRIRGGRPARTLGTVLSAAICGVGVFWFVSRCFAPSPGVKLSGDSRLTSYSAAAAWQPACGSASLEGWTHAAIDFVLGRRRRP